jgi:hypothetical protein
MSVGADRREPRSTTRARVREMLLATPEFALLPEDGRRRLARSLVELCDAATDLSESPPPAGGPRSLAAADEFGGAAIERLPGTTERVLAAISFPRFVEELLNGVFKAMVGSSVRQMEAFVELLDSVAASAGGFADRTMGDEAARQWLVEQFPGSYVMEGDEQEAPSPGWSDWGDAEQPERTVRLRGGATAPTAAALRTALGLGDDVDLSTSDPERLLSLVRQAIAGRRQNTLASLVMLGLNRIVVESGSVDASMRFHIDARSAAEDDRGSTVDLRHTSSGGGSFGAAGWGVSASMTNTIGYVRTEQTQTTEEISASVDLNSSVRINFKSDYVPLSQLAGAKQVETIRQNSRNPEAPEQIGQAGQTTADREKRDTARREAINARLGTVAKPPKADPAAEREQQRAEQIREGAIDPQRAGKEQQPVGGTQKAADQPPAKPPGDKPPADKPPAANPPPPAKPPADKPPADKKPAAAGQAGPTLASSP